MNNDLPDQRTPPADEHKERPSRDEVEAALSEREEAIERHADALQREVGETGATLIDVVVKRPWLSVGGAIALGLGVSWLRERRKQKRRASESTHRLLTELYMDALADDVNYQVRNGKDADEAVYGALQDRVPLIFQEEQSQAPDNNKGRLRKAAGVVVKAATGFAIKKGLDYLTDQMGPEDFAGGDHEGDDAAAVTAAAS